MQESVRRIIEAEEARMGKISNIWRKQYPENNVIFSRLLRKNIIILDSELFFTFWAKSIDVGLSFAQYKV